MKHNTPSDTVNGEVSPASYDCDQPGPDSSTSDSFLLAKSSAPSDVVGTVDEMPPTNGLIRAKQTERLIAALVPPTSATLTGMSANALTVVLPRLSNATRAKYEHRIALLDDHGRVREATLFAALGWKPNERLGFSETADGLVFQTDPKGPIVLDPRGRLRLPDAQRKFRGFNTGDALVLSASTDEQTLVVSPSALLDRLVILDECA